MAFNSNNQRAGFPIPASNTLIAGVLCSDAADLRIRRLLAIAAEELPPSLRASAFTDLAQCKSSLVDAGPSLCLIDDAVGFRDISRIVHAMRDTNRRCACVVLTDRMDLEIHARYFDYGAAEILMWQDTVAPERAGLNIYRALRGALQRTILDADLSALQQRFDYTWQNSPSPFFRVEAQGHIIACNEAFADLLGYKSPAEVHGRPLLEMGDGPEANVIPFRPKVSDGGRLCFLRNKDGEPVSVELLDEVAPGEHLELQRLARLGGPQYKAPVREGFVKVQIPAEVKLREQLTRYEAMYNSLFSGMAEGFVLADARGRMNAMNPAAERALGIRLGDVHGQHIDDVLKPVSGRDENTNHFSQVYDGRERVFELSKRGDDGTPGASVWVRCKASLIGIPGATKVIRRSQFLVSLIDITEQVEAEKRASGAELGTQLVQGVSHDMRNYLTAISSSAALMGRLLEGHDPALLEYAKQIEEVALSSAGLLNQGLRVARPSVRLDDRLVRVDDALAGIELLLRSICPKRIRLECELGTGDLTVLGQKRSIEQIVINLTLNAKQALTGDGVITLSTEVVTVPPNNSFGVAAGKTILVKVADNGPGIEPEVSERMFEPFYSGREGGSGLGLAMVRELTRELGGGIACTTSAEQGTTFTIALPCNEVGPPSGQVPKTWSPATP